MGSDTNSLTFEAVPLTQIKTELMAAGTVQSTRSTPSRNDEAANWR